MKAIRKKRYFHFAFLGIVLVSETIPRIGLALAMTSSFSAILLTCQVVAVARKQPANKLSKPDGRVLESTSTNTSCSKMNGH